MEYSPVTGLGRLDFILVRYTDTQAHRLYCPGILQGLVGQPGDLSKPKALIHTYIHTSLWGFLLLLVMVVVVLVAMVVLHVVMVATHCRLSVPTQVSELHVGLND